MIRIINANRPKNSFDNWMCNIVKSIHYTNDHAMGRARNIVFKNKEKIC